MVVIRQRFFWIEDFIEINKRHETYYTHTKYTNYIVKRKERDKQCGSIAFVQSP